MPTLGPQAYHIIRTSQLTIFLLDPLQRFRERDNTSLEDIVKWSRELRAGEPELISLEDIQFRCAGSAEYVLWIESVLSGASVDRNKRLASASHRSSPVKNSKRRHAPNLPEARHRSSLGFKFALVDTPAELERELRNRAQEGNSVRLLSSYSREWKTVGAALTRNLPPAMQDFYRRTWRVNSERPGHVSGILFPEAAAIIQHLSAAQLDIRWQKTRCAKSGAHTQCVDLITTTSVFFGSRSAVEKWPVAHQP